MTNQYILNKARETIAKVSLTEKGEEYKQREYFGKLLPQVMQLRSEGISFQQIAALLEKGGLKLSPSTVKDFYSEFNFQRMQDLVMEMDDQLHLLRSQDSNNANTTSTVPDDVPLEQGRDQAGLRCLPLKNGIGSFEQRPGVADEVYCDGMLEHPAIPGLMLTKEERTYRSALEIVDANGEQRLETPHEQRFRIKWQKPIPRTPSSSGKDFVTMDMSLFASIENHKRPRYRT